MVLHCFDSFWFATGKSYGLGPTSWLGFGKPAIGLSSSCSCNSSANCKTTPPTLVPSPRRAEGIWVHLRTGPKRIPTGPLAMNRYALSILWLDLLDWPHIRSPSRNLLPGVHSHRPRRQDCHPSMRQTYTLGSLHQCVLMECWCIILHYTDIKWPCTNSLPSHFHSFY